MGDFLETVTGGAVWGIGFGLAASLVQSSGGGLRSLAKGVIRAGVVAADWMRTATEESRETLQDLYHEAKAEHINRGTSA